MKLTAHVFPLQDLGYSKSRGIQSRSRASIAECYLLSSPWPSDQQLMCCAQVNARKSLASCGETHPQVRRQSTY